MNNSLSKDCLEVLIKWVPLAPIIMNGPNFKLELLISKQGYLSWTKKGKLYVDPIAYAMDIRDRWTKNLSFIY